jgi:hypothetical protein
MTNFSRTNDPARATSAEREEAIMAAARHLAGAQIAELT